MASTVNKSSITAERICLAIAGQFIATLTGLVVYRAFQEVTVALLAAVLMSRIMYIAGL